MNRQIKRLSILVTFMLVALMVAATYIQVVKQPQLTADTRNVRTIYNSFNTQRGPIIVDGKQVASSVPADDNYKWQRVYEQSNLYSSITGYLSVVSDASTGIENYYSNVLNGNSHSQALMQIKNIITGEKPKGGAIELTINSKMQEIAAKSLKGKKGSVVALNPKTGAILAMYSNPNYDANSIATHNRANSLQAFNQLNGDNNQPLINKAISSSYPPGSSFKIITAAAMLSNGVTPDTIVDAPRFLSLPESNLTLPNYNNNFCGSGKVPLKFAFGLSCNTPFAKSAMNLGPKKVRSFAKAFGFDTAEKVSKMPVAKSNFPSKLFLPQLAYSAIGQYEVRATPLQMAMVAATVANNGVRMKPYVVNAELGSDLKPIAMTRPQIAQNNVISPKVAEDLKNMMKYVISSHMTTNFNLPGISVAAKTGTAETGVKGQDPHSWLVGFAPADDPQIAFAVLVEGISQGSHNITSDLAARTAESILRAGLKLDVKSGDNR